MSVQKYKKIAVYRILWNKTLRNIILALIQKIYFANFM